MHGRKGIGRSLVPWQRFGKVPCGEGWRSPVGSEVFHVCRQTGFSGSDVVPQGGNSTFKDRNATTPPPDRAITREEMTRPATTTFPIAATTFFHGSTCCWPGLFLGVGCWHGGGTCHSSGVSTRQGGPLWQGLEVLHHPPACCSRPGYPPQLGSEAFHVFPRSGFSFSVGAPAVGRLSLGVWVVGMVAACKGLTVSSKGMALGSARQWDIHQGGGCGSPMGALKNALQDVGPWFWRLPGGAHQWRPGQGR